MGITTKKTVLSFAALAGCFSIGLLIAQLPSGSTGILYTVTGTIKDLRPNGDVAFMDKFVRGVRADGSQAVSMTRIATVSNRLLAVDKREVIDTVNARDTNIDVTTKSLSTVPLDQQELSHLKARRTGTCATAKDGVAIEPTAPLFGLSIVKVTTRWKDPEGAPIIAESWLAPDLNCASLREVISKQESSGNATPMKITEVTSLVRGEPDAALFAIPAGYTERMPGQISKTLAGLLGLDCPECAIRGQDHANARYQQKRAAAGWK